MLKKVQPKVWWGAGAALIILIVSWGLIRRTPTSKPGVAMKREIVEKLDPKPVSNPNTETSIKIQKIEEIFNRKRRAGFNGNVLVVQDGEILYQHSFGYAHIREKDTLTAQSRFQLASLSKPFTAVAILQLIEEGKLSLNDSIQTFFPDFPYHGIKIDMLLSHRSGLPNYVYSFPDSVRHGKKYPSNMTIMDWYAKVTPRPAPYGYPGRGFQYCNTNYCVLAAIVEKVTHASFDKYVTDHIFIPLGMSNTFLVTDSSAAALTNRTVGHQYGHSLPKDYFDEVVGDKGVYSTTGDIYRFYNGLTKGYLVNKKMLKEAFTPRSFERAGIRNYGYGFRMHTNDDKSPKFIYHGGWWKGYNTMLWVCPKSEAVIIVLGNTYNKSTYDLRELLGVVDGDGKFDDIDKDI